LGFSITPLFAKRFKIVKKECFWMLAPLKKDLKVFSTKSVSETRVSMFNFFLKSNALIVVMAVSERDIRSLLIESFFKQKSS
jgi:hypothetical protein